MEKAVFNGIKCKTTGKICNPNCEEFGKCDETKKCIEALRKLDQKEPCFEGLVYVHVVRCKDCKNFRPENYVAPCKKVMRCEDADENWFCADGERKE